MLMDVRGLLPHSALQKGREKGRENATQLKWLFAAMCKKKKRKKKKKKEKKKPSITSSRNSHQPRRRRAWRETCLGRLRVYMCVCVYPPPLRPSGPVTPSLAHQPVSSPLLPPTPTHLPLRLLLSRSRSPHKLLNAPQVTTRSLDLNELSEKTFLRYSPHWKQRPRRKLTRKWKTDDSQKQEASCFLVQWRWKCDEITSCNLYRCLIARRQMAFFIHFSVCLQAIWRGLLASAFTLQMAYC